MESQGMAVEPDVGVHVDAVEAEFGLRRFARSGNVKSLAIPPRPAAHPARGLLALAQRHIEGANSRRRIAAHPDGTLARCLGGGSQVFQAPVVRKIELAPRGIIEAGGLRSRGIPAQKPPALVEGLVAAIGIERRISLFPGGGRRMPLLSTRALCGEQGRRSKPRKSPQRIPAIELRKIVFI